MEWKFPIRLPRFTTEEFEKKKAEHVAKHGYTIYIPGIEDIFKLDYENKPTEEEVKAYRKKDFTKISQKRYEEIRAYMKRRKAMYLRMMESPEPSWMRNISSVMCTLDDVQDCLAAAGLVGRVASMILPAAARKALAGPLSWVMTMEDIARMWTIMSKLPLGILSCPKFFKAMSKLNPLGREARLRRAWKLKKGKFSKWDLLQAAQSSNTLFGVGTCMGALIGLAQDIITGYHRAMMGEKVKFKMMPPPMWSQESKASRATRAPTIYFGGGQEFTERDHMEAVVAANLATQVLQPYMKIWNPLDQVENWRGLEIHAPVPTNPVTLCMFEDLGVDWKSHVGWPFVDKEYVGIEEWTDTMMPRCLDNMTNYLWRNRHNIWGGLTAYNSVELIENTLGLLEGEEDVDVDYNPVQKQYFALNTQHWRMPCGTTGEQAAHMYDVVNRSCAAHGVLPVKEIVKKVEAECGFKLTTEAPVEPCDEGAQFFR